MERKRALAKQKLDEKMNEKVESVGESQGSESNSNVNITINRAASQCDGAAASSEAASVSFCQRAQDWFKYQSLGRTIFLQIFGV